MKHPFPFSKPFLLSLFLAGMSQPAFAASLLAIFAKGEKPSGPVFIVVSLAAMFMALAIHELGHLLAGLAQGFRFHLYVVGLLGVKRTETGIKVYLNKDLAYMGGVAATVPAKQDPANRHKFALAVLAGPVASLLFAAFCAACFPFSHGAFRLFWLMGGAMSVGFFLATTIPGRTGIFFTDRARFFRLMNKGRIGQVEEALLEVLTQNMVDGSGKNVSLEKARLLQTDTENFNRFWGHYYEYLYFKDNDETEQAEVAREKLVAVKHLVTKPIWKALKIDES